MPVRKYSELHPDQQDRVLGEITGDRRAAHEMLQACDSFVVIVDGYNRNLTLSALPCSYQTYLREQQEINTGRWEVGHAN